MEGSECSGIATVESSHTAKVNAVCIDTVRIATGDIRRAPEDAPQYCCTVYEEAAWSVPQKMDEEHQHKKKRKR